MAPAPKLSLDALPRTAATHANLLWFTAVLCILTRVGAGTPDADERLRPLLDSHSFLGGYIGELQRILPAGLPWEKAWEWWRERLEVWEDAKDAELPLVDLAAGPVGREGLLALTLVGLVEEDARFGTLFNALEPSRDTRWPTAGLLAQLAFGPGASADAWRRLHPLLAGGFLEVRSREGPRGEWELRIPSVVWEAMRGGLQPASLPWARFQAANASPPLEHLILAPTLCARLNRLPALFGEGAVRRLVLRGLPGSQRLEVAAAIARALGRGVIEVSSTQLEVDGRVACLGALCVLLRALPVVVYDLAPGEVAVLPLLPDPALPVVGVLGQDGGARDPAAGGVVTIELPLPDAALRARHLAKVFGQRAGPEVLEWAARMQVPEGTLRRIGDLALRVAALDGRQQVRPRDVREARRNLHRDALESLATPLQEASGAWDQLVVNDSTASALRDLELRCRYREQLPQYLRSAHGGANRGVRALFQGPSGTGKTLAARLLGAALEMDVYRVELAAIVNKFIGETEKNLQQVLNRAEALDVILLLDEGDSLLARRTDVATANDRYANLQTNYLLQRLESYQGICLVTTNAGQHIDRAFQRRIDVTVDFQPPQAAERLRIWQLHLRADAAVGSEFLEEVALRCALSGGQIRNAALHAALLALDGRHPVSARELRLAVQREYVKAGALSPLPPDGQALTAEPTGQPLP